MRDDRSVPERAAQPVALPPKRRPPLWVLIVATAMGPLSLQIVVPSLPGMARGFDTTYATAQLALTLYLIGLAVAQLAYGPLSDRFGRRPALLAGIALFLAGTLLCLVAQDIGTLLAGRVLQAVGGCAGIVLSRAIVRDLYEREKAASMIAYITVGMVVAPMLAPIAGAFLDKYWGLSAVFGFVLVFGLLVGVAVLALLHETHHERRVSSGVADMIGGFVHLLRMRRFRGYSFQVAFTTASFFSFLGGASYVTVELMGLEPEDYAFGFVAVSGSYMVGNFVAGRITARVGSDRMITIGTVLSMVAGFVLLGVTLAGGLSYTLFFLLGGAMSVGNGFSMPNGFAGAVSVDPSRAGSASGLSGALQMGTGAVLMTVVGVTLAESALPVVAMMLTGAILAWLAHLHGLRKQA